MVLQVFMGFFPRSWVYSHNGVIKKKGCNIISKKTESQEQHKRSIYKAEREVMTQA